MTAMPTPTINLEPARPGEPTLRWASRVRSIAEIEPELARIWSIPNLTVDVDGAAERRIAARTSVLNLVVIARRPELGERAGAELAALTGRHPSRTLIVAPMDPDGPSWIDARLSAYCMLPRPDAPETCAESIFIIAGGEAGRHLSAIIAPLLIHDLPVTLWWLGEPPLGTRQTGEVLQLVDRLVVDGSSWSGDGLARLRQLAALAIARRPAIFDFALVRQARWREAIASVFDRPEFLAYLTSLHRVAVTYAAHEDAPADATNVVKPIYHVSWLASRLELAIREPMTQIDDSRPHASRRLHHARHPGPPPVGRGLAATLVQGSHPVHVVVRPLASTMRPGTTLRVELLAERRGSELRAEITAEAEVVHARLWQDGIEAFDRLFRAPRLTEVDLLDEAIETTADDPVTRDAIRMAGELVEPRQ